MSKKNLLIFIVALGFMVLIAISIGLYSYGQTQTLSGSKKNNTTEQDKIIKEIGKFMLLPTDEKPTLATVTDKNRLIGQMFFQKAENGDKVLIYAKNKKAILFRPANNKIIEVGALAFDTMPAVTPAKSTSLKLIILNGTNTPGLALQMEQKITDEKIANIESIDTDNAKKKDYQKSVIIDLTGKKRKSVDDLASRFDLDVLTKLPDGEKTSTAEAVIIVGEPSITP